MLKKLFLRWWLFTALTIVGAIFTWKLGGFYEIYMKDASTICWYIFAGYVFMSAWCGYKTWQIGGVMDEPELDYHEEMLVERTARYEEIGWFMADQFQTLGLIGTIAGMVVMFQGESLANVDVSNAKSMIGLLIQVAYGIGTALYTTLVGLICSGLLKAQYFNLSHAIDFIYEKKNQ